MATFIVRHHLYPRNPKKFTVSLDKVAKLVGEPNTIFPRKGSDVDFWEIRIAPPEDAIDIDGNVVKSLWIDTAIQDTIDSTIVGGINQLSELIDWSQGGEFEAEEDRYAPKVTETVPVPNEENVPIDQVIKIVLEDLLPASGIDMDTVKLYVDNIEIVPSEIKGNPFRLEVYYKPPSPVLEEI
jgi:hypothetical protein